MRKARLVVAAEEGDACTIRFRVEQTMTDYETIANDELAIVQDMIHGTDGWEALVRKKV